MVVEEVKAELDKYDLTWEGFAHWHLITERRTGTNLKGDTIYFGTDIYTYIHKWKRKKRIDYSNKLINSNG